MSFLDTVGMVGEMLSWVGVIVGLPSLAIGLLIRIAEGPYFPTHLTIIEDLDGEEVALWTVGERTHTQILTADDHVVLARRHQPIGYFSQRNPERIRCEKRRPAERACKAVAVVMLATAGAGFIASLLPLLQ